ncbi:MAG: thiamine pyrophosphate-dependent dehydrogenase E1 component subunit alpha [Pararhodobacter sp.]
MQAHRLPAEQAMLARYRAMVLIRRFEERVQSLFRAGRVPGLTHLCIGQEAVAAGVCSALRPGDRIASTHRGHGHSLAMGADPDRLMAEILGRETGYGGGRGGSMHVFDAANGNLGTNGIVGGAVPLGLGAALAARNAGKGAVAVAFFGDGAMNQGVVLECFNMAALWRLPLILVCEHNGYGEFTASDDVTAGDLSARGAAFDLPVQDIDGMDVEAVHQATAAAVDSARQGGGPGLLFCRAWRFSGHHAGDGQDYKDDAESRAWRARDPIPRQRARLIDEGLETDESLTALEVEISDRVQAAARRALGAPEPSGPLHEKLFA